MRRARPLFLALAMLLLANAGAQAHTRSETHSSWQVVGDVVHLTFTIPQIEVKRLNKIGIVTSAQIGAYLSKNLGVKADKNACPSAQGAKPVTAEPGYLRFEFTFQCASDKAIELHSSAFFELVPTHTNFAQVRTADGHFIEQLITADHQTLDLSSGDLANQLQSAGFFEYVKMGMMHIFTGIDHQLFLVGLILLSRRLKDLLFVVTGFTIGHSITLALAVTGVLRPHAEYIDSLIGLTIALVGCELVAENTHRAAPIAACIFTLMASMAIANSFGLVSMPTLLLIGGGIFGANYLMIASHVRDAARLRLVITMVFGLIHGFGFAAGLLEMKLPTQHLAELLVGFNLGVELGQVTIVLAVVSVGAILARTKLAAMRPLAAEVAAAFLVGIGLYWFVSRGYAAGGGYLG